MRGPLLYSFRAKEKNWVIFLLSQPFPCSSRTPARVRKRSLFPAPDPSQDYVQLQVISGYSSNNKAMCVNYHEIVLGNIQMSFHNPCM